MTTLTSINEKSVPYLPAGMRLKHDKPREQWVILAPERMYVLDDIALEIMKVCDGQSNVGQIVDDLAARFNAPREAILNDVTELLQDFADKGVVAA